MSFQRCSILSTLAARAQQRSVHISMPLWKKKYNFDLDSLIKFKTETALVFGTPRKTTKTGKARKPRKPLDPEIQRNLETLGAISNSSQSRTKGVTFTKDVKIVNGDFKKESQTADCEFVSGFLPFDDACDDKKLSKNRSLYSEVSNTRSPKERSNVFVSSDESKDFDISISDDVLMSILPPPDAVLVSDCPAEDAYSTKFEMKHFATKEEGYSPNEYTGLDAEMEALADAVIKTRDEGKTSKIKKVVSDLPHENYLNDYTEDGIYIPRITPVPISASSGSKEGQRLPNHSQTTNITSLQQTVGTLYDSMINIKNEKSNDSVRPRTQETFTQQKVVKPQSQSTFTTMLKHPPFPPKQENELTPPVLFEPPESFAIVPKFPLSPCEQNTMGLQTQLENFKSDVEQLALRYPPSVKSILNKTMPALNRFFLNRWRENMIRELGEQGFKQHQEATISRGINLHSNIMEFLSGKPLDEIRILPDNQGHWASLQSVIEVVSDVRALEVGVMHPELMYKGIFDCVARYKDLLCLIDWKVSKKPRPLLENTYDDPVQVAAYVGAVNSDNKYTTKFSQMNHGMIVVVYPDGSPAHIHILNKALLEQFWQDWTNRLQEYFSLAYTEKMARKAPL